MKLELTEKEYETLVKMVYAGNWMINGLRDDTIDEFLDLEQKIFLSSRELKGGTQLLKWDKKYENYLPSEKMEDVMDELIDEYDEQIFWNELIQRLASRDILDRFGDEAVEAMSEVEESEHIAEYSQTYSDEFENNGIRNLVVKS